MNTELIALMEAENSKGTSNLENANAALRLALEAAQAENERLNKRLNEPVPLSEWQKQEAELTAALARLAELEKQEPVGFVHPGQLAEIHEGYAYVYPKQETGASQPLYAAAGASPQPSQALEPTDDQLVAGVKAMRLFVTKNSLEDFRVGFIAAINAKETT